MISAFLQRKYAYSVKAALFVKKIQKHLWIVFIFNFYNKFNWFKKVLDSTKQNVYHTTVGYTSHLTCRLQLCNHLIFMYSRHQWRIQKILVGGDLKHKTLKIRVASPKLRVIFQPKSEIQTFFSPKIRWSPKKKKVFTKIETDFSAGFVTFRLVGGMHPEMEPNYSK